MLLSSIFHALKKDAASKKDAAWPMPLFFSARRNRSSIFRLVAMPFTRWRAAPGGWGWQQGLPSICGSDQQCECDRLPGQISNFDTQNLRFVRLA
jgi:hypothetical protein